MEPRYKSLMLALQPQPREIPPPPFPQDKLQEIFAEVIRHHSYQSFGFTPNGRGALFKNSDDDVVELRPALLRVAAKMDSDDVLTSGAAQEKAMRIVKIAAAHLKIEAFLQCAVQVIGSMDAPGGDARAFLGGHLLRNNEQASTLGDGYFGGGVRYRCLYPGEGEDNLSVEPDVNNNSLIFLAHHKERAGVTGPITVDDAETWIGEAFDFLKGPTMALLSE
jgi:hypothetical protein